MVARRVATALVRRPWPPLRLAMLAVQTAPAVSVSWSRHLRASGPWGGSGPGLSALSTSQAALLFFVRPPPNSCMPWPGSACASLALSAHHGILRSQPIFRALPSFPHFVVAASWRHVGVVAPDTLSVFSLPACLQFTVAPHPLSWTRGSGHCVGVRLPPSQVPLGHLVVARAACLTACYCGVLLCHFRLCWNLGFGPGHSLACSWGLMVSPPRPETSRLVPACSCSSAYCPPSLCF